MGGGGEEIAVGGILGNVRAADKAGSKGSGGTLYEFMKGKWENLSVCVEDK